MIIALMGNDGTGKTTLSQLVYTRLRQMGFDVECRRGFEHFLVRIIIDLLSGRAEDMREIFMTKTIKKPSYYRLWPYLVWLDCILKLIYMKIFKRKQIVIFDRYTLDFLVSWEYFGYGSNLLRGLYRLLPLPKLSFILDAPAEVTFTRSKFNHKFPFLFYKVQRKRYLALAKAMKIRVIDTTKPIDKTSREILDIVEQVLKYAYK